MAFYVLFPSLSLPDRREKVSPLFISKLFPVKSVEATEGSMFVVWSGKTLGSNFRIKCDVIIHGG